MRTFGAKGAGRPGLGLLARWGGISLLSGVAIETCFAALIPLATLRGPALATFLAYFVIAGVAYALAVARLGRDRLSLRAVWAFAILFRLTLLLTSPPTLSDDVYRFIWDGRLANAGVSPYAHAVNSPLLDAFDTPQRALVNNNWMASPYLPAAQALFAATVALMALLIFVVPMPVYAAVILPLLLCFAGGLGVAGKLAGLRAPSARPRPRAPRRR